MNRTNFILSAAERADARAALILLRPFNLTLEQAARIALSQSVATVPKPFSQIADAFLRTRLEDGRRPATFTWYEERLGYMAAHFGDRPLNAITPGEFSSWLAGSRFKSASRAAIARAARALWNWAMQQQPPLAAKNAAAGLAFESRNAKKGISQRVISPEVCAKILHNIADEHRSAIALMMLAGIRPEEVAGDDGKPWLPWSAVNITDQIIRIEPEYAKSAAPRILEKLPGEIWKFLRPRDPSATVATVSRRSLIDACKRAAGIVKWPQDGLRHSFASYALAHTDDPGKVSMWLGHEGKPTLLHTRYRGVVTKAAAEQFFAMRPAS